MRKKTPKGSKAKHPSRLVSVYVSPQLRERIDLYRRKRNKAERLTLTTASAIAQLAEYALNQQEQATRREAEEEQQVARRIAKLEKMVQDVLIHRATDVPIAIARQMRPVLASDERSRMLPIAEFIQKRDAGEYAHVRGFCYLAASGFVLAGRDHIFTFEQVKLATTPWATHVVVCTGC